MNQEREFQNLLRNTVFEIAGPDTQQGEGGQIIRPDQAPGVAGRAMALNFSLPGPSRARVRY